MHRPLLLTALVILTVGILVIYASNQVISVPFQEVVEVPYTEKVEIPFTERRLVPYTELQYVPYADTQSVPYTETQRVPYTEVQAVPKETINTVQEQAVETRRGTIFSINPFTLEPGRYAESHVQLRAGTDVAVSFDASDTISVLVFNSQEFAKWGRNQESRPEFQRTSVSSGTFGVRISVADTYYFVTYNEHTGLFGIGSKKVGILRFVGEAQWQETVTRTRTERGLTTVTETLTKTRTDTLTKTSTQVVTKTSTNTLTKTSTQLVATTTTGTLTKTSTQTVTRLRPESIISYYTAVPTSLGQFLGAGMVVVGIATSAVGVRKTTVTKPKQGEAVIPGTGSYTCRECGTENPPRTRFCKQCGSRFDQ